MFVCIQLHNCYISLDIDLLPGAVMVLFIDMFFCHGNDCGGSHMCAKFHCLMF